MNKLQGKIITRSVMTYAEGMQVIITGEKPEITFINKQSGDLWIANIGYITGRYVPIDEPSMIEILAKIRVFYIRYSTAVGDINIPLKYSQWQSALDNEDVIDGELVEFQIVNNIAEIIQPGILDNNVKLYSESEVIEIIAMALLGMEEISLDEVKSGYPKLFASRLLKAKKFLEKYK